MNVTLSETSADTPATTVPQRKARIWPVLVALIVALLGAVALQIIAVVASIAWALFNGQQITEIAERLPEEVNKPALFMLLISCGQVAFALAAVVPAWLSPVPFRQRLGLLRAQSSWTIYPAAMLGSLLPLAVGLGLAYALTRVIPADPSVALLYENMTLPMATPFVLLIALAPGVCEELLFRGYVQRRLLARWSPWVAIGVTSIFFALMHIMPHAMVLALPLGLWLGGIAWRTGSILPSIACHAFVNGSLNAYRMIVKFSEVSETAQRIVETTSVVVGLVCFIATCWLLRSPAGVKQMEPVTPASAPPTPPSVAEGLLPPSKQ